MLYSQVVPGDNNLCREILPHTLCVSNVPKARPYLFAEISHMLNGMARPYPVRAGG